MQNDQTTVTTTDNEFDLDDLLLTEAQEQDVKAGGGCPGCGWGPPLTNHNETVAEDASDADDLDDLLLTAAQEADIKAGCLGCGWGPPLTNHNETVAEDQEAEVEVCDDLAVANDEQVKGGPAVGSSGMSQGKATFQDLHLRT